MNIINFVTIIKATRFAQQGVSYSDTRVARNIVAKVGRDGDFYSRFAH